VVRPLAMLRAMAWTRRTLVAAALTLPLSGCVKQAEPDPAEMRTTMPPWPAPRDAVSYIDLAHLARLPLNASDDPHVLTLEVFVAGQQVEVPAYVGIDRLRAVQAPCHTHDASGTVWIEGSGGSAVTLGQFFDVWGVRLTATCLGAACGSVSVTTDGQTVSSPRDVRLRDVGHVVVRAGAS
jgi:hypothetical protein